MNKILFITALGLSVLLAACNSDVVTELKTPVYKTKIASKEMRASAFKGDFPTQYASYLKNNESSVMTEYKGSINFMKNDGIDPLPEGYKYAQPYLKSLWLGYPFMYEYREARGHTYAVEDFLHIDRINRYGEKGGLPATCWNCKTPKMVEWVDKYGDSFWANDVNAFRQDIDPKENSISCLTCHNPETMELQLYSVPLKDWLVRSGRDLNNIPRNEMRSLVCGQCHVEYYFTDPKQGVNKKPVFPWDKGFGPGDMYEYYTSHGDCVIPGFEGQFADWVHPASQTPMIKMQHPEYETWIDGTHGAAGVSCADCHMPYSLGEDKKKMSSHWWTSPLKDAEMRACRQCHSDKTPEYLRSRVLDTQKKTFDRLLVAQEASVRAHEAVRLASEYQGMKGPDYDKLMIEARTMVRKSQLYWDYVSAENSVGFHNPTKALSTLTDSILYSQKAVDLANQAANFSVAQALAGDIKQLVPPIQKMSRKMQQDPATLESNPWLKYLKPLPESPQFWDGQKRSDGVTQELPPLPKKS